ncbi:efflux RND transporter periplasmic adaptor subunit [Spirosoma endbachense]|uniref:Efflux RND transporter periplasmic adaptor subunit n=1 Tax=Spirosoma endbachense TaxID=2666025 RepID=A0A6P1VY56_9BACT|nr:efflux RND transporter periplasmic adaptor subunit [Spirosoma endbachense]QHV97002.1 efflux RND transporter periplasmic adaptor subunit [Spirosoma endbachense]
MKRIIIIGAVAALIALIVFRLINNKKDIEAAKTSSVQFQTTPVVDVQPVSYERLDQNLALLGTVEAQYEGNIISETRGKLQNFKLVLGSFVKKGQQVGYIQDEVQGIVVENNQTAVENAKREMERYERLLKGGAVTQETYQKYKDQYATAILNSKQQQRVLGNGAVVAPISGYVYDKKVENGEYVAVGAVLASVINLQELKLVVNVPEQAVYQLKQGDKATITAQAFPGVTFSGSVHYISPKGDDLHNYPVEIYLSNNSKNQLKAGTLANANFTFKKGVAGLFIPRRALVGGADSASVYVVQNNIARLRKIRLGYDNGDQYQVLDGLKQGEPVVVNGQLNLSNGAKVTVNQNGAAQGKTDTSVAVNP